MLPNSEDNLFVKITKICGLFVFPMIIVTLLLVILMVPAKH